MAPTTAETLRIQWKEWEALLEGLKRIVTRQTRTSEHAEGFDHPGSENTLVEEVVFGPFKAAIRDRWQDSAGKIVIRIWGDFPRPPIDDDYGVDIWERMVVWLAEEVSGRSLFTKDPRPGGYFRHKPLSTYFGDCVIVSQFYGQDI